MSLQRTVAAWAALFVLAIAIGAGTAFATHRLDCYKYADSSIYWYNGGTGSYYYIFEEEAVTDSDSWHNYTDIDLTEVFSPGTTDHFSTYNGWYGNNGWLGIADFITVDSDGCTVLNGRARLNQSYLDGTYSRTNKEHVACQEIGHLFGLAHQGNSVLDSCMANPPNYRDAPQPNEHDQELINSIY